MCKKCGDIGVDAAVITGKTRGTPEENRQRLRNLKRYKRGQSIAIFNYWSYVYAHDIAEPDLLVIDDADGFESLLNDHYSLTIEREKDRAIWESVVRPLAEHKVYQKLTSFLVGGMSDDYELIYFPHSLNSTEVIKKMILAKGREGVTEDLFHAFDENKDRMHTYLMFVSNDAIILTPQICPASMHPKLRNVKQIVFMSATIGSPEILHKRLGFSKEIKIISDRDLKSSVGTMGKRIIFPLSGISPSSRLSEPVLEATNRILSEFDKALVLCVSYPDAYKMKNYLELCNHSTLLYKTEADVEQFRQMKSGALISAGRFFGVDLSSEACRVCIIPRLPFVLGPTDLLLREVVEDGEFVNEKVSHRLVQCCGRCNRSSSDKAAYFVLDGRLGSDIFGDSKIFNHFPDRMRAETDYGQEYAENGGLEEAIRIAKELMKDKIADFDQEINDRMTEGDISLRALSRPYIKEIEAWHALCERRNYVEAAKAFREAAAKCSEPGLERYQAWLHYLSAFAFHLAATQYQDKAYDDDLLAELGLAIKIGYTSWFSGLQVVVNELTKKATDDKLIIDVESRSFKERVIRTWQEFFATHRTKRETVYQAWEKNCDTLLNGTHNAACVALEVMLELLGFEVRSWRERVGKPDLLAFSVSGKKYVCIIEVKTRDQGGGELGRDEVDQVTGHKSGYQSEYPDQGVYPLVFTNKGGQSATALEKAKNNARILRAPIFVAFM
jgi:hypothetical protein